MLGRQVGTVVFAVAILLLVLEHVTNYDASSMRMVVALTPRTTSRTTATTKTTATSLFVDLATTSAIKGNDVEIIRIQEREQENWIIIPEGEWRMQAKLHRRRIHELLQPGLTDPSHEINSGRHRKRGRTRKQQQQLDDADNNDDCDDWTALDPKHPIYNFLIEYYGLRGSKGPRRLARWFPDPALMLSSSSESSSSSGDDRDIMAYSGILLEGATEHDWGSGHLHLRGARQYPNQGIVYSPSYYYPHMLDGDTRNRNVTEMMDIATPFLWYQGILKQTLESEPVLHCYGLHEWAMQYYPEGAKPPPSAKYQNHLPLRVSQQCINDTVERKGIRCTHVDALRYFAPAAGPYNKHGIQLQRLDQLRLEQSGCVHAHMDLIKLALRIQPFCNPELIRNALEIAIQGRRLDVAGSPYDCSSYGVQPIPIETSVGRNEFQLQQVELKDIATPVRQEVLEAYDVFLKIVFNSDDDLLREAQKHPAAERFAKAEPGGMPWRKNLIE